MDFKTDQDKQEITRHQQNGLPLAIYRNTLKKQTGDELMLHWHEEFQLTFIVAGTLTFFIEGEARSLTPNTGLFINSRVIHSALPHSPTVEYVCINFPKDLFGYAPLTEKLLQIIDSRHLQCWEVSFLPHHSAYFSQLKTASGENNFLAVFEVLLYALNQHQLLPSEAPEARPVDERIFQLIDYIHQNYQTPITLQELAQQIPLNKNKCTALFKEYTGLSPINYLIDHRLSVAKQTLLTTNKSITEICFETGFNNLSYFSRRFKEKFRVTPQGLRGLNKQSISEAAKVPNS